MNPQIVEMIQTFESNTKNKKEKYKEFLAYIYMSFGKKIFLCKKDKIIDKYKKIRDDIIKLIIVNEKQVIREFSK